MSQPSIPAATAAQQAEIAALAETIRAAEARALIDALVAALYGLTPAEAAVVSGAA